MNSVSDNGVTPLIIAAAAGHTDVVNTLLETGADPTKLDANGNSALDWAKKRNHAAIAEQLTAAPPS